MSVYVCVGSSCQTFAPLSFAHRRGRRGHGNVLRSHRPSHPSACSFYLFSCLPVPTLSPSFCHVIFGYPLSLFLPLSKAMTLFCLRRGETCQHISIPSETPPQSPGSGTKGVTQSPRNHTQSHKHRGKRQRQRPSD